MKTTGKAVRALLLCACAAGVATPATAQAQQANTTHFDVASEDLGVALTTLVRQSNREIYFAADLARGKRSPRISGVMTIERALDRMLEGTGLRYRVLSTGAIVVEKASQAEAEPLSSADQASEEAGRGVAEILVTGARTLNADIRRTEDDAQPYVVYNAKQIERSGANNVEAFLLRMLSANAANTSYSQAGGGNPKSTISLRGLGDDETLILIDGRRAAGYAQGGAQVQPDVNAIPIESVERIEVLPTSASGIYGGSATGGVINIILKRDYTGVTARVRYGDTIRGDFFNWRADLNGGASFNDGDTSVTFAGSYSDAGKLLTRKRNVLQAARATILANDPGFLLNSTTPPLGSTSNIRSTNGSNLTLKRGGALNSPITFVPVGYTGIASDNGAGLIANAGSYNLALAPTAEFNGGGTGTLVASPSLRSAQISVRQKLTPWLNLFLQGTASANNGEAIQNGGPATISLAATDAGNPFNQAITITTPNLGNNQLLINKSETYGVLAGVVAKLGGDWSSELDYGWTRVKQQTYTTSTIRTADLRTAVATNVIDIFRTDNQDMLSLAPYIYPQGYSDPFAGTFHDLSLRTGGTVPLDLPGGRPKLTTLLERRKQNYGLYRNYTPANAGGSVAPPRSQEADSVYLEAVIPIVGPKNHIPALNLLELQLSGRYEKFQTHGANIYTIRNNVPDSVPIYVNNKFDSIDPTFALRYQPIPEITFRASYGSGFLSPSVSQLTIGPPSSIPATTPAGLNLRDPARGNEVLGAFTVRTGGNPNLVPERTKSYSLGAIATIPGLDGFRASLDWTKIKKRDAIYSPAFSNPEILALFITNFPERFTRAAPEAGQTVGKITEIDASGVNIASLLIEAWDYSLSYDFDTKSAGTFNFLSKGTYFEHSRNGFLPGQAPIENAGTFGAIRFKANATLTWSLDDWTVQASTTYYSSYYLQSARAYVARQGSAKVPAQSYTDIFVSKRITEGALKGLEIQAGINNLFDKRPPVDLINSSLFLYSTFGDPIGARWYVSLKQQF